MRSISAWFGGLPVLVKVALIVALLGLLVWMSPLVVVVAGLLLFVALLALVIRLLSRRPLRRWGITAAASLALVIVFSGISGALYGNTQPERAASPQRTEETKQTQKQETRAEPVEEKTTQKRTADEDTAAREKTPRAAAATERKPKPGPKPERPEPKPVPETAFEPAPRPAPKPDVGEQPDEELYGFAATATVTRVVDGDTIEISPAVDGYTDVRLIGMDTPETYFGSQPYGPEASAFTSSRLEGKRVGLEFDAERIDPYEHIECTNEIV